MTITTITGVTSNQVTPGAGNYAATLTIAEGGTIDTGSTASALWVLAPATVENDGVILTTGTQQDAAMLEGGPALLLNNGTIDGVVGVYLANGDTLINAGRISYSGSFYGGEGVYIRAGGALFNSGTIIGVSGVEASNAGTIQNSGVIYGDQTGASAAGSSLYNSGSIGGGEIGLIAGPSTNNSGDITGGLFGVAIEQPGYALSNGGSIFGGRYGVVVTGDGVQLTNAGSIGGVSDALYVEGANFGLTLLPGASFYGLVKDTAGRGTLVLGGTAAGTIDIDSFSGFSTIEYAPGAAWTVLGHFGAVTSIAPVLPVSIIAGPVTLPDPLSIGANGYADSITITSTGKAEYGAAGVYFPVVGTITNAGHVSGTYEGVGLAAGGTLLNEGSVSGTGSSGIGLVAGGAVYVGNGGVIAGLADGISLAAGGVVVDSGSIAGAKYAILNSAGSFTLVATGAARFTGAVSDAAGNGVLSLTGDGVLDAGSFGGFSDIEFGTGAAWTLAGGTGQLTQGETIAGFTTGDTIVLDGFAATQSQYYPELGLVLSNGASYPMLHFSESATAFDVTSDGSNTTITTATCFCRGTRIATPEGETPVEELSIGDEVVTLHTGAKRIKWIGRRSYAAPFAGGDFIRPIRIRPGALGEDIPRRALHLSPGHAVLCGGALVQAWRLLNGASVTQAAQVELVEYYHIELEAQEVIFAEGCPVESYIGAELRGQFHNAAEFAALYPDDVAQAPCLALLEEGFALQAVQRQVAARAGLPPAPPPPPGVLHGFVDVAGPDRVEGWAQDAAAPELPVVLDVLRAGLRIGRVLANRYRADLRLAGLGTGCHAFHLTLPPGEGEITVARAADGQGLPLTEAATQEAAPG